MFRPQNTSQNIQIQNLSPAYNTNNLNSNSILVKLKNYSTQLKILNTLTTPKNNKYPTKVSIN